MAKHSTLFHYTVGPKLPLILASSALLPTGFGLALSKSERPVLWWSAHPHWEPTATKILGVNGGRQFVRPSLEEMTRAVGAYRFRFDGQGRGVKVHPWPNIARLAKIDEREVAGMVKHGLELGARPRDWFGVLEPVALTVPDGESLLLEELTDSGWVSVAGGLAAAALKWTESTSRIRQSTVSEMPAARGI